MITVRELKDKILHNQIDNSLIIFKYTDTSFLACQYIKQIAKNQNKKIEYIEDLSQFNVNPMFYVSCNTISVYFCDELKQLPTIKQDLFIVTKKCSENEFLVDLPKLEEWQKKDYLYSVCKGADTTDLDYLFDSCKHDISRISNECDKIKLFSEVERKYLVKDLFDKHLLPRNDTETIFDFTNALFNKDLKKLSVIYENIENLDIEPLGVVTILYKNLKNMILVGFQNNPTEQNTGLTSKQIWGVRNSLNGKSAKQILDMFKIVSDIDFKLKSGQLPADMILDYTVMKCLAV